MHRSSSRPARPAARGRRIFALRALGLAAGLSLAGGSALAQGAAPGGYPSKTLRIVAPFPAGGASDVMARLIGQKLQAAWGQTVIVENRPGANGNIGASHVAKSDPDGHTLLLMDLSSLAISPSITPNLSYSPSKDLAPVIIAGYSPHLLVVSEKLPVKSVEELVQYAKAHKGKLNFGVTPGAITHLAGVLLAQKKGLDWSYVPYKGGAQVMADLAGGQVDIAMNSYLATYPLVKSGRIKMLAVASEKRFAPIPDTPTVAESIPGFVTGSYQGILVPAGTPQPIVRKIHEEVSRIVASPEIRQRFAELGTEAVNKTPEEFGEWLARETVLWAKVVKDGNVKVD